MWLAGKILKKVQSCYRQSYFVMCNVEDTMNGLCGKLWFLWQNQWQIGLLTKGKTTAYQKYYWYHHCSTVIVLFHVLAESQTVKWFFLKSVFTNW